jgi:hypothetical protein
MDSNLPANELPTVKEEKDEDEEGVFGFQFIRDGDREDC